MRRLVGLHFALLIAWVPALTGVAASLHAQPSPAEQRRAERLAVERNRGLRAVFDAPQLRRRETGGRAVPLVRDALVARESYQVHALRRAIDADVTAGAPFRLRFRAGDLVLVRAGDPNRSHCLLPDPLPRDAAGRLYPDVCLIDRDGDARYEIARFVPEDIRDPPRDVGIAPVALRVLPPAAQPGLISFDVEQRLRVSRLGGGRATILVESRIAPMAISSETPWTVRQGAGVQAVLRFEDGATARLSGLQLRVGRGPSGGWQVTTEGEFEPWLVLRDGNTIIDTGAITMGAQ